MSPAAPPLALDPGDVHLWCAWLDVPAAARAPLHAALAPDERARTARRGVARGVLRTLLGRYLGEAPDRVPLRAGPGGKPELGPGAADSGLRFNLSHTDGLALYAVARGREVGVDVERVREVRGRDRIAARYFAPAEQAALAAAPEGARAEAFLRAWTRAEAGVKLRGEGLAGIVGGRVPDADGGGSLVDLAPAPGYVAALAAAGRGWRSTLRWWAYHDAPRAACAA